jgi:hypothetical protein
MRRHGAAVNACAPPSMGYPPKCPAVRVFFFTSRKERHLITKPFPPLLVRLVTPSRAWSSSWGSRTRRVRPGAVTGAMEAISNACAVEPDCARYQIFGTLPSSVHSAADEKDENDDAAVAEALEATRAACMSHLERFVEGYIWQKGPFQLQVVANTLGGVCTEREKKNGVPAHLSGTTRFGDNIEDEWFIVWMLKELTVRFPSLVARVWDDDGEFLLIETAFHLPKWVKPDAVANRVWLKSGALHVVPPSADEGLGDWARPASKFVEAGVEVDAKSTNLKTRGNTRQAQKQDKKERDTPPPLTVEAALWLVRGGDGSLVTENKSTKASKEVNAALDERLAKYPEAAIESMHRCVAMLPGRIHLLLKKEPTLIAAAVETFYLREPGALGGAARHLFFPLENMQNVLVTTTKCLFAQMDRQRFEPSKGWAVALPGARGEYFPFTTFRLPDCPYETDTFGFYLKRRARARKARTLSGRK